MCHSPWIAQLARDHIVRIPPFCPPSLIGATVYCDAENNEHEIATERYGKFRGIYNNL